MNLLKLLGFGVLIWDVVFITDAALKTFEIFPGLVMQTVFIIVAMMTFLLSENLGINSGKKIFKYGLSWAAVMILLDVMVAVCCLGWGAFSQYSTWINYAIVVFMPVITTRVDNDGRKEKA